MSIIVQQGETLFFCFGQPKSGTTLLQRMLDCHPEVSCPSEHQFNYLHKGMSSMFDSYNRVLCLVDSRTGGQGASLVDEELQKRIYRCSVEIIIRDAAKGKKVYGANDNAILNQLDMYGTLFELPKMIVIFRNPVDAGISAWHHNLRLGQEESPAHKEYVMQYGGFDGWMKQYACWFNKAVMQFRGYSEMHGNTLLVRYEDILLDKAGQLERMFTFLGVGCDANLIIDVITKTDFYTMKNESGYSGFFRSASSTFGKGVLDDSLMQEIAEISKAGLAFIGYDIAASELLPATVPAACCKEKNK